MTAPPPSAEMLDALTQCAYRLGRAFAAEAERAQGQAMLDAYERFSRCFFSVRMGIALQLRLRRAEPAYREAVTERDPAERELTEREPSDHHTAADPRERERDRETERASVPLLLNALETVAADAASLPGRAPAALLTLRELLGKFSPTSAPAPAVPPPRPGGDLRTRLAATASASILTIPPPLRHATGPPRR